MTTLRSGLGVVTPGDRVRQFDWETAAFAAMLVLYGLTAAFAAGGPAEATRQGVFAALGLVLLGIAAGVDYRRWAGRAAWTAYALALLALVFVRLKGHTALGGQRWLTLGPLQLQPSEFAKVCIIIAVAHVLARRMESRTEEPPPPVGVPVRRRRPRLGWDAVVLVGVVTLVPTLLIIEQPDLGTAIVAVAVALGMLYLASAGWKQLGSIVFGLAVALPVLWPHLHPYQRDRLLAFLQADSTRLGIGYNLYQAKIAIGSGQAWGQGFLGGTQAQLHFLPSQRTDFIFAVLAEEFGFAGGVLLLVLFALLLWRLFRVASSSRDPFGLLLAGGVAIMIFTQVLINVGMNLGVMPIAGIPLPFISIGGSSMWTNLAAVGLVQSVWIHRRSRPT